MAVFPVSGLAEVLPGSACTRELLKLVVYRGFLLRGPNCNPQLMRKENSLRIILKMCLMREVADGCKDRGFSAYYLPSLTSGEKWARGQNLNSYSWIAGIIELIFCLLGTEKKAFVPEDSWKEESRLGWLFY